MSLSICLQAPAIYDKMANVTYSILLVCINFIEVLLYLIFIILQKGVISALHTFTSIPIAPFTRTRRFGGCGLIEALDFEILITAFLD